MRAAHHNRGYHPAFWGIILIAIGLLTLLHNAEVLDLEYIIGTYWPLILVIIGIVIIAKAGLHRSREESCSGRVSIGDHVVKTESNKVYYSNVFGDHSATIDSKDFEGGKVSTVFGDVSVDLQNLDISAGEQNLYVSGVFGDIKVSVPKSVPFSVKANCVLGSVKILENKREGFNPNVTFKSADYDASEKRLNIFAHHVFGDIKVW